MQLNVLFNNYRIPMSILVVMHPAVRWMDAFYKHMLWKSKSVSNLQWVGYIPLDLWLWVSKLNYFCHFHLCNRREAFVSSFSHLINLYFFGLRIYVPVSSACNTYWLTNRIARSITNRSDTWCQMIITWLIQMLR